MGKSRNIILLTALLCSPAIAQEHILIDFGMGNEITASPDLFGSHWNNIAGTSLQLIEEVVDQQGNILPGVTLEVTDAFAAQSTNSLGGEPIYVATATGDFLYTNKTSNTTANVIITGLDNSGATVYDFKFFISSNRLSPQTFLTDYTAYGLSVSETVTLEAVANLQTVASLDGIIPAQDGSIEVIFATNSASTEFGGVGVVEIIGRGPSDPVAADPQPVRFEYVGGTPNPPAEPSEANPYGLTAYVWEVPDNFSRHVGAAESLRRAGFHVQPLPLDRPPFNFEDDPETDVDLILFGSMVSQSPEYAVYMAAYADILDDYIDRAGYLVQLAQADQTESRPPFLPDTQDATRIDPDYASAFILSPDHPMIQGFPLDEDGKKVFFEMNHIPAHADDVIWETFDSFKGFEVILAADERARFPGMMEGAYGQGQLLLVAMAPDKIIHGSSGVEQSDPAYAQFNEAFFSNLYEQTKHVRDRTAVPINITPQPGDSEIEPGAWTIALLPDTQIYSQNRPGVFSAQTIWLRDNARRYNIRYVLHLGDIVNVNSRPEWVAAREAMGVLDGNLPYAIVPGNHDYGPSGNASTRDTYMNEYFLFDDYKDRVNFGGAMVEGMLDNTYHLFSAGGYDWIVMALEWGPRDLTIEWADGILQQYPDRKAILVTHAYMNNNDYRYDINDPEGRPQLYNPHNYRTTGGVNDGEELWQKLVRKHNFVLTVNGHVLGDGTGFRTDPNDAGQNVHQMLVNYQFLAPFGGNGFLRLLIVKPSGEVEVKSYSPIYNTFRTEADQAFTFDFEWYDPLDSNGGGIPDYFDPALDSDGDGLSNYDEFVNYGTDPYKMDSDGDGIPDGIEVLIGTNPAVDDSQMLAAILDNASKFGLYSQQSILDMNVGRLMITRDNGELKLQLQVETAEEATGPYEPAGEPVEWMFDEAGDKAFFRIKVQ